MKNPTMFFPNDDFGFEFKFWDMDLMSDLYSVIVTWAATHGPIQVRFNKTV